MSGCPTLTCSAPTWRPSAIPRAWLHPACPTSAPGCAPTGCAATGAGQPSRKLNRERRKIEADMLLQADAATASLLDAAESVPLADAEAAMDAAVADFVAKGPDPAAFERIKTQIRAGEIYARDDVHGLARVYGEELAIGLSIQDVQDWDDILGAVTIADVQAAARKVLDRNHAVTGWLVLPEETSGLAPAETPEEATE